MANYKLTIEYDGTRYHGWERKRNLDTIQGKIEDVLTRMTGETELNLIGAGRTDAGVHARGMVANIHLKTPIQPEELRSGLNRYLPEDIAVREVRQAADRFHARYNAAGKTYRYTCSLGKNVFQRRYVTRLEETPDVERMRRAADFLMGQHDFRSFCGNPKMKKSTIRTIDRIDIERRGDLLTFTFHGDGFLQHMVRILVGTLIEVGCGRMEPEQMPDILVAQRRSEAGPTAPAGGLTLMSVDY